MANASTGDGARLKMIANGESTSRQAMLTPTTLARLEDPRAWHARGEVGIQRSKRDPRTANDIALPMAPPLPKGRVIPVKKVVLEEDEYVERLGDIIEGDYFPHNARMLRALSGLVQGAGVPGSATPSGGGFMGTPSSVSLSTPGGTTPGRGAAAIGKGKGSTDASAGTGGALTKFVATHTSEDNQAFAELQEKDQEAFRRRYFWAYDTPDGEGNNATSTKLLILPDGKMMSVERREQMDAACADRPKIGDDRPNQVETWKHRTRNQLMFSPSLAASKDTCRLEAEPVPTAPLLLEGGGSKSRSGQRAIKHLEAAVQATQATSRVPTGVVGNALESPEVEGSDPELAQVAPTAAASSDPASTVRDESNTVGQTLQGATVPSMAMEGAGGPSTEPLPTCEPGGSSGSLSPQREDEASVRETPVIPRAPVVVKAHAKVIQAHATRFPVPQARPPRQGPWASPIEKPSSSRESVAEMLAGTKEAPDYAEVPMTPSRVPGVDGDSPQITWGSIDGTPMILDPRATPLPDGSLADRVDVASIVGALGGVRRGHQFEVKDLPPRDILAHRLEAIDTRRKRAKLGLAAGSRGTRTPTAATPLTPRTPGTGQRTPGTGQRTPRGGGTPGKGRTRGSRGGAAAAAAAATSTPAARTLAAKLALRQSVNTPFGGGLTPGRQKKRSRSSRGGSAKRDERTPLPSTPGAGEVGTAGPAVTKGKLRGAEEGKRSSLTDGLLALK